MVATRTPTGASHRSALANRLERPRYEVLPLDGIADAVQAHVPRSVTVTVTASPRRGLDATVVTCEALAGAGYDVVPHLSARLVRDEAHLLEVVDRLLVAGVDKLFVPAGDAPDPAGAFDGAGDLLAALGDRRARFSSIGITGYPESHHLISDEQTIQAMTAKSTMATCITSQICFDAATVASWISAVRARGTTLPIWIGVPGVVDYAKLLRISTKIGLGESTRFLRAHRDWMKRLVTRQFKPTTLVRELAPVCADPAADVAGFHLYTFNEVEKTERWRVQTLERLRDAR